MNASAPLDGVGVAVGVPGTVKLFDCTEATTATPSTEPTTTQL